MTVLWLMQLQIMILLLAYDVLVGYVIKNIVDVSLSCYSLLMLLMFWHADAFTIAITAIGVIFSFLTACLDIIAAAAISAAIDGVVC
jgi:hypothetical protein